MKSKGEEPDVPIRGKKRKKSGKEDEKEKGLTVYACGVSINQNKVGNRISCLRRDVAGRGGSLVFSTSLIRAPVKADR